MPNLAKSEKRLIRLKGYQSLVKLINQFNLIIFQLKEQDNQ